MTSLVRRDPQPMCITSHERLEQSNEFVDGIRIARPEPFDELSLVNGLLTLIP